MEGVLFAMGNSVEKSLLAETMEISLKELDETALSLSREYEEKGRGLRLLTLEDRLQLSTAEGCYETLIKMVKRPNPPVLTDVVLETLAIIAYKQPITRAEIEAIRGVSSDHAVNRLIEYRLIEEKGRLNAPGRPIQFGTTQDFLRSFGLQSLDDLPVIRPDKVEDFKLEAEQEYDDRQMELNLQV